MAITVPPDIEDIVNRKVGHSGFESTDDVLREALRLLDADDVKRRLLQDDLIDGINSGEAIPAELVFQRVRDSIRAKD